VTLVDCFASESHFADHLRPVYRQLKHRGDFHESHSVHADTSHAVVVASYGDVKRVRKLGYTRIARMEHGAGQSYGTAHGSYAGGKDHDDVSLFLMPNHYSADLWQKAYPAARVEVVGSPKLDTLPTRQPGPPVVALGFHWDCYLVPETVSAFQHYRYVLPELAAAHTLLGHGHPRGIIGPPSLKRRYRRAEIPLVEDFNEVCRQADLYICDNSSSMYEFASTGRPVVVLNQPMYRRNVHHGLRFWDAIPGVEVNQPGELLDAVALALEDAPPQQQQREAALAQVYAFREGAAQRAADILRDWA